MGGFELKKCELVIGLLICLAVIGPAQAIVDEPLVAPEIKAFPQGEAGIAAYINTSQAIDLEKMKTVFSSVEMVGDNYILGLIPIPDWGGDINVHLYADTSGWIVAYLKKDEPVSRIMQWGSADPDNPSIGVIQSTTLEDALYKAAEASKVGLVATDIKYYDFEFPNADKMMIVVKTQATDGSSIMQLQIPAEYTLYEASYYYYSYYFGWSKCCTTHYWTGSSLKVDDSLISVAETGKITTVYDEEKYAWWRAIDQYKGAITAGKLHTIEISHVGNNAGSAGVATVLIYRSA